MRTIEVAMMALGLISHALHSAELCSAFTPSGSVVGMLSLPQIQSPWGSDGTIRIPKVAPFPRGRIRALHFSRDERFVLAQDPFGITVLTVQPFSIVFHVVVEDARFAGFTPDSQELVFVSPPGESDDSHVEHWRLTDGFRVGYFRIPMFDCESSGLSPDGQVLVCVGRNGTLRLTDVASGKTIVERTKFGQQDYAFVGGGTYTVPIGSPGKAGAYFSPDSHFVIVRGDPHTIVWDLRQNTEVQMSGRLKHMQLRHMAFIQPDRVLLSSSWQAKHGVVTADLVEFPSGKVVSRPKIPPNTLYPAADPGFVLVRPVGRSPFPAAAAANLATGQVIISNFPALDVFGHFYVVETSVGEVGLYEIGTGLQASVKLPSE